MNDWHGIPLKLCDRCGGHYTADACPVCPPDSRRTAISDVAPEVEPERDRSKWWKGRESELHDLFALECLRRGVSFIHARTDQKSTIRNGWPDFSCFRVSDTDPASVLACFIEFKTKTGKTSKDQDECIAELAERGIPVLVTGDFAEAVEFLKQQILK